MNQDQSARETTNKETIPTKTKQAVLKQTFDIEVEEVDMPDVADHEALVKVMAVGVCGSDVHYYEHGKVGDFIVEEPLVLGHECSGEVVKVGKNVTHLHPGDRVAIEPGVPCGHCDYCKSGKYNLCPDVVFMATPPVDGAFTQYVSHAADFLYPIPDELSYEQATLIEPFSVGLHACKRVNLQPGSSIVIMGMGPVGLMAVVAAKAFGATNIIVTDLEENRLDAARELGATHLINIKEEDPVQKVFELTNGKGASYAFETAGNPIALQSALESLRADGKLAIVGLPQQDVIGLNIPFIANREIDIFGVFRYSNTYPMGIEILATNNSNVDTLFTDFYSLDETKEAMEQARVNKSESLKVIVYPNGK